MFLSANPVSSDKKVQVRKEDKLILDMETEVYRDFPYCITHLITCGDFFSIILDNILLIHVNMPGKFI